ncbi:unnamed protein product [Trifolium pratense]|uniref:Uncharacterized protein n=1 Tax=Trifolium pratense TaxID=57577 RepID=A0ACB0IYS4_TRIPR|nr:unnamed protein product [Trifolium pratense]
MYQNTIDMATAATTRSPTQWSREDAKIFERALLMVPENSPNRWEKMAEKVPGKSAAEVKDYYQDLVHEISEIESGRVEIPIYPDDLDESDDLAESGGSGLFDSLKETPWTKEEQRLILAQLEKCEKEDWFKKGIKILSWDKNTHR